jgi:type I restriction enzyme S subunit
MLNQVGNLMQQTQKLRAARDLLLPRLMSGEISV